MIHAGGAIPGGYRYVELWSSRDEAMAFHDAHVRDALSQAGLDRSRLDVQLTEIEYVTNIVIGNGVVLPSPAEVGS